MKFFSLHTKRISIFEKTFTQKPAIHTANVVQYSTCLYVQGRATCLDSIIILNILLSSDFHGPFNVFSQSL